MVRKLNLNQILERQLSSRPLGTAHLRLHHHYRTRGGAVSRTNSSSSCCIGSSPDTHVLKAKREDHSQFGALGDPHTCPALDTAQATLLRLSWLLINASKNRFVNIRKKGVAFKALPAAQAGPSSLRSSICTSPPRFKPKLDFSKPHYLD
jgi:hypothetical protein